MGIPGLCATTLRHSWATNALKNGMDSTTASILMGHRDPATLIRNYQHLTQDTDYLQKAAKTLPITLPPIGGSSPTVPGVIVIRLPIRLHSISPEAQRP